MVFTIFKMKSNVLFLLFLSIILFGTVSCHEYYDRQYVDGKLKSQKDRIDDTSYRLITFNKDGVAISKEMYRGNVKDGPSLYYSLEGDLVRRKEEYKNGTLNGKRIEYNSKGGVASECFYRNGQLDGKCVKYGYESGKVRVISHYKEGKLHGLYKKFNDEGLLACERTYNENLLEGQEKCYNTNGTLQWTVDYTKGIPARYGKKYDTNGDFISKTHCRTCKEGEPCKQTYGKENECVIDFEIPGYGLADLYEFGILFEPSKGVKVREDNRIEKERVKEGFSDLAIDMKLRLIEELNRISDLARNISKEAEKTKNPGFHKDYISYWGEGSFYVPQRSIDNGRNTLDKEPGSALNFYRYILDKEKTLIVCEGKLTLRDDMPKKEMAGVCPGQYLIRLHTFYLMKNNKIVFNKHDERMSSYFVFKNSKLNACYLVTDTFGYENSGYLSFQIMGKTIKKIVYVGGHGCVEGVFR